MWFMWILWGILALAVIASIILLTGKGNCLVTGFNTKSREEKDMYDKKKISRQTGIYMLFIDIGLIALAAYIQFRIVGAIQAGTIKSFGTEITIVALAICAYIIVIGIVATIRGFNHCKK